MTETITRTDDFTGIVTKFTIKSETEFDVLRTQDVEPILEANKEMRDSGWDGYTEGRDMKLIANIPLVVYEQWARKNGVHVMDGKAMKEIVRKELRDPDNAFLRTSGGRI